MTITIKHRWNDRALFSSETATHLGQAVREAIAARAVLSDADLRGAVLSGADLSDADLRDAVGLTIEQITGKALPVPVIPKIHQTLLAAITAQGNSLEMAQWHSETCETTHCRGGWICHLAGAEGKALEDKIWPAAAAMRIYLASDPTIDHLPKWHASNADAMADIVRQAERERAEKGAL